MRRPTVRWTPATTALLNLQLFCPPSEAWGTSAQDAAAPVPALIASPEPGWPQWRGPRRDGISDESGLLAAWPKAGPPLRWTAKELGHGYSAPVIDTTRVYITGDVEDELRIFALDPKGRKVWEAKNGAAWKTPYPGARASCTLSEGRLYHLNAHGRIACLDAATGRELWAFNMFERFGGKNINWAVSENVLVDGPRLIITPGGTQALMAALDKKTGETIWRTPPLRLGASPSPAQQRVADPAGATDHCSYSSPILFEYGGRRQIVSSSMRHVFGVDAESGALLWTQPFPTRYFVIAGAPVLTSNGVFVTAPHTPAGGKLFRFSSRSAESGVEVAWTTPLDTCHGGVIYLEGTLYGSWYGGRDGWAAVDVQTGAVRYQRNDLEQGSGLWADGRLYCLTQEGEMVLMKPGPEAFEITGRFRLVQGRQDDVWAHPVIWNQRLYLRYHDTLYCYDIAANLLEDEL